MFGALARTGKGKKESLKCIKGERRSSGVDGC